MKTLEVIAKDEIFTISDDETMDIKHLNKYIAKHQQLNGSRYKKLKDGYEGFYPIMMYQDKPQYKPDNRIIVNFAKYIVDTFNGFLLVFQSRYHQQMKRLLLTSMNWIREIIKMITMQRFQKTAVSMANVMKCILSMKTQRWVLGTLNQLKDLLYMMIQSFQSQGFSLHITMIQIVLCMVI